MSENEAFMLKAVADYAGARLGLPVTVSDLPAWAEREAAFDRGDIDVVWICGLPYVWKADRQGNDIELLAAPVIAGDRYRDQPIYFSEVLVRADSGYRRFEDLRGGRWGFNEPGSHSGYNIARHRLSGLDAPERFFGQTVMTGSHLASLSAILDGHIDASAIDSIVLELYLRDHPADTARFRSLETLGPSPIPPLVIRRSVPAELRAELRRLLLEMHLEAQGQAALAGGPVRRYAGVSDTDYDPIRQVDRLASTVAL